MSRSPATLAMTGAAQVPTAPSVTRKGDPAMQTIDSFLTEWATAERDGDTSTGGQG
jgi:hypothetical protein